MTVSNYDLAYLITNVFGTYTIYKFMRVFFDKMVSNGKIEFLTYVTYFSLISSMYLYINIPIVMLICNVILFFLLSYNYEGSIKNRVMSVAFMYLVLMTIESIIALLSGYLYTSIYTINPEYSSIFGVVAIRIVSYMVILLIGNYKQMKKGSEISFSYWLSIFLIPLGSLYIILVIFQENNMKSNQVIISLIVLLFVNFIAFYLYEELSYTYKQKTESLLLKQQNQYYIKQFDLIEDSLEKIKAVRHDMRNHLSTIEVYINNDEKTKALDYISKMYEVSKLDRKLAFSGNMEIDSILNFKLQEAELYNIKVLLELRVPTKLRCSTFDLVVIMGNILDNAIQATCKLDSERRISIQMIYNKSILIINVSNTFDGKVLYNGYNIATSHVDKENHGLGLNNTKAILKKYNGTINISYSKNEFNVSTMMYVE